MAKRQTNNPVLDIGSGNGRYAIMLAERGIPVYAIEKVAPWASRLRKRVKEMKIPVRVKTADVRDTSLPRRIGGLIATNSLHFIPRQAIVRIIHSAKEATEEGGIHVISVFTEMNPDKDYRFLFPKKFLRSLYSDWEVVDYRERFGEWEQHGEGPIHRHHCALIMARRPTS